MADDARTHLFRSLTDENSKYTYFLLAAAGAAIGFAITQTRGAGISIWMLPLAAAVLSWAVSFFCGCRHLQERQSLLFENHEFLHLQDGQYPGIPAYPQLVDSIRQDMEERRRKTGRWGAWQFRFLVAGAVFYVAWHVIEMYLRTFPAVSDFTPG